MSMQLHCYGPFGCSGPPNFLSTCLVVGQCLIVMEMPTWYFAILLSTVPWHTIDAMLGFTHIASNICTKKTVEMYASQCMRIAGGSNCLISLFSRPETHTLFDNKLQLLSNEAAVLLCLPVVAEHWWREDLLDGTFLLEKRCQAF